MTAHEQFANDLALYAMGALAPEERVALETHLAGCDSCRRELELLRGDTALLALSASGAVPPPRARQRFIAAIAQEPRRESSVGRSDAQTEKRIETRERVPARASRPWWGLVPAFAAAALVLVAFILWRQDTALSRRVGELDRTNAQQMEQLQQASQILATLSDPAAARFTLAAAAAKPQPQGKAIYARDRRNLIFIASNMPELPPQKAYELWLIPTAGAPIPAGVFKPDASGSATVIDPPLPEGVTAKTFAVTVEPEAGSAAPTSAIIMVGTGG